MLAKIKYTAEQTAAIKEAYNQMEYAAEAMTMAALGDFARAANMERREAGSHTEGMALVASAVYRGLYNHSIALSDISGHRPGYILLVAFGAQIAARFPQHHRRVQDAVKKASDAHREAIDAHVKGLGV